MQDKRHSSVTHVLGYYLKLTKTYSQYNCASGGRGCLDSINGYMRMCVRASKGTFFVFMVWEREEFHRARCYEPRVGGGLILTSSKSGRWSCSTSTHTLGKVSSLYDWVSRLGHTGVKGHSAGNRGAHMLNVTQQVAIATALIALFTFME